MVLWTPVLPVDWMLLVATVTVPVSFAFGRFVASRRDDGRGRSELVGGSIVVTTAAALAAPLAGLPSASGVLVAAGVLVPSAVYLEGVLRRGKGLLGLVFPVVLVLGGTAGVAITGSLGFAGPDPWLDWGFLTSATSRTPTDAGIYPALVGSALIVLVIALTAFPVGVGAAIYLEEYAPSSGRLARFVELVEINIGNLAGVPSIVYGLLGLALFVQGIGLRSGIVIVGGLTVGLLILPIVIISAQEALRAVPDSRRQASYGMGATRWQTIRDVVLPEALPGILTGTILALGRAIGETAPLLMIGIASSVRSPPSGLFSKTGAMPRQIFSWSSEIQPEFHYGVLAAGVIVLVAVLLAMNGSAIVLRNRYHRRD
jgi:phosphate transport system permease protein